MSDRLKAAFTAWPYCLATYVALIGAAWLLFVPFEPVKRDPTVYPAGNPQLAAETAAKALDGRVWVVSHTGSMKPLLQGGEYAVTVKEYPKVKLGQVSKAAPSMPVAQAGYDAFVANRRVVVTGAKNAFQAWLGQGAP